MSLNKALNAAIALIEGRTDIAKEYLRSPDSDVKNVPQVLARLERAVNKTAARAIRNALVRTLSIQYQKPVDDTFAVYTEEGFYVGVATVEKIIEQIAEELDPSLKESETD